MRIGRLFIIRPDLTLASVFPDYTGKKHLLIIESEYLRFYFMPKKQKFKEVKELFENYFCEQKVVEVLVNNANLERAYVKDSLIMDTAEIMVNLN